MVPVDQWLSYLYTLNDNGLFVAKKLRDSWLELWITALEIRSPAIPNNERPTSGWEMKY